MHEKSMRLAEQIQENIVKALGIPNRGVKGGDPTVLAELSGEMPAVLLEIAFVCNADDYELITTPEGRNTIAESIFSSMTLYYRG